MDEHRDPVDELLDHELGRIIDVQPSATFVARVREQVAAQPTGWIVGWWWKPAAITAVAVVALWGASVLWSRADVPYLARVDEAPSPAGAVPPSRATQVASEPSVATPRQRPGRRHASVAAEHPEQVLVSRSESDAIRTFLNEVSEGRGEPPVFLDAPWSFGDPFAAIEIPLLAELTPLSVAPITEGVDQ